GAAGLWPLSTSSGPPAVWITPHRLRLLAHRAASNLRRGLTVPRRTVSPGPPEATSLPSLVRLSRPLWLFLLAWPVRRDSPSRNTPRSVAPPDPGGADHFLPALLPNPHRLALCRNGCPRLG